MYIQQCILRARTLVIIYADMYYSKHTMYYRVYELLLSNQIQTEKRKKDKQFCIPGERLSLLYRSYLLPVRHPRALVPRAHYCSLRYCAQHVPCSPESNYWGEDTS